MELSTLIQYNFASIMGLAIMSIFLVYNEAMDKQKKGIFMAGLWLAILEVFSANMELYFAERDDKLVIWRIIFSVVGYLVRPMIVYLFLVLVINYRKNTKLYYLLGVPLAINTFFALSIFFSDMAVGFSEDNTWYGGPFSHVFYVILGFYVLVVALVVTIQRSEHSKFLRIVIYACVVLVVTAMACEYEWGLFGVSRAAVVLSLIAFYMFYQSVEYYRETDAITYLARHDGLTGIYNRYAFDLISERLSKSELPVAFLISDIDKFKTINDTYGHTMGDLTLKRVAKLFQSEFSETKNVIRLDGDEFVIMMEGFTKEDAEKIVEKIIRINDRLQIEVEGKYPKTSISACVAFSEKGYTEDLYKAADAALYERKNTTRRGCTIAD